MCVSCTKAEYSELTKQCYALSAEVCADSDELLASISDDVVEKVITWHIMEENPDRCLYLLTQTLRTVEFLFFLHVSHIF